MQQPHVVSRGHSRPLTEISFVEDGSVNNTFLVSAAHDKLPQVRDGETCDWIGSFIGHKGAIWSTKIDKLTRTIAVTASGDFSSKLWCATSGKELHEYKHNHVVKSVDFSNDSERFITGCQDGFARIFDTAYPDKSPVLLNSNVTVGAASDPVNRVHWGNDTRDTVIVGKRSGLLELWDLRCSGIASSGGVTTSSALSPTLSRKISEFCPVDIELDKSGGQIWVASGTQVHVLSLLDFNITRTYDMPAPMSFKEEGGLSLHPNKKTFMAGASDLWLREFDVATGEVLRTFKGHHGPIRCVRYHPCGDKVASGSEDATIRLWKC